VAAKTSRTTFAKLDRERKRREKREDKKARREARKAEAADAPEFGPPAGFDFDGPDALEDPAATAPQS